MRGAHAARLPARWGQGTGGAGGCARAGLVERERGLNGGRRARASGARAAGENACARLSPEREGARERAALEEMGLGREWSGRGGARLGPRMRERRPVGLGYVERGKRAVRAERGKRAVGQNGLGW